MATLVKNAFHGGPGSHCNLCLDAQTGIVIGTQVAIGTKYTAIPEAFLPNNKVKVRMNSLASPGSFGLILRKGSLVV
jgi:hypothetical protein